MNESTRATRSATAAETTATIAEWYTSLGSDKQVSSVLRRFITDPQETGGTESDVTLAEMEVLALQSRPAGGRSLYGKGLKLLLI